MHHGIIVWAVIMVILIVVWGVYTGFAMPKFGGSAAASNSSLNGTTSTVQGGVYTCIGAQLTASQFNSTVKQTCSWKGGVLGMWAASGNTEFLSVTVKGGDGKTYLNSTFTNPCNAFIGMYDLPAQDYNITVRDGLSNKSFSKAGCEYSGFSIGNLPNPNSTAFDDVPNGGFITGTYYAWNTTGNAFGSSPLNITKANAEGCYPQGAKWSNNNETYFASTYACGYGSNRTGSLTSSVFTASKGFLNFQVLGSGGTFSYIEVLYKNSTRIKAYFNTNNISNTESGTFAFTNATIPLLTLKGKPVQVRVVVNEEKPGDYILLGNFRMGGAPLAVNHGILVNMTVG